MRQFKMDLNVQSGGNNCIHRNPSSTRENLLSAVRVSQGEATSGGANRNIFRKELAQSALSLLPPSSADFLLYNFLNWLPILFH